MLNREITLTESELSKLLKKAWKSANKYTDQLSRINQGYSNFTEPTYPDRKSCIKELIKSRYP